jgi:hypothetical protein
MCPRTSENASRANLYHFFEGTLSNDALSLIDVPLASKTADKPYVASWSALVYELLILS